MGGATSGLTGMLPDRRTTLDTGCAMAPVIRNGAPSPILGDAL